MTDPVIRTLTADDAGLFDAHPDPLSAAEGHRETVFRTEWKRVEPGAGDRVCTRL